MKDLNPRRSFQTERGKRLEIKGDGFKGFGRKQKMINGYNSRVRGSNGFGRTRNIRVRVLQRFGRTQNMVNGLNPSVRDLKEIWGTKSMVNG